MKKFIYLLSTLLLIPLFSNATRWYVDVNNNNIIRNGNSWNTAVRHIRHLENDLEDGDEVWIAQGTYNVEEDCNIWGNCFQRTPLEAFGKNITIFGGFEGNETSLSQRNPDVHITTIVSSSLKQFYWFSDVAIDGFKFTGGTYTLEDFFSVNSGNSVLIKNCDLYNIFLDILVDLDGVQNPFDLGSMEFEECNFEGLEMSRIGFSEYTYFRNCEFSDCTGIEEERPLFAYSYMQNCKVRNCVMYELSKQSIFENTLFEDNIINTTDEESPFITVLTEFRNCTLVENSTNGRFYSTVFASTILANHQKTGGGSAVSGSSDAYFSLFEQQYGFGQELSNIIADPLFVDEANGDYQLSPCSPAINVGFGTGYTNHDLAGNSRVQDGNVDIGCYEFQGDFPDRLYVDNSAMGNGSGTNWTHAITDLQDALDNACPGTEIWIKEGVYKPGNSRDASFRVPEGVEVYGGFDGSELTIGQRDYEENITLLSGAIGGLGNQDNSYQVVTLLSGERQILIDGVAIMYANANGDFTDDSGGAVGASFPNAILRNCYIGFNRAVNGAAIHTTGSGHLILENVRVENNTAVEQGGGLNVGSIVGLSPQINVNRCTFKLNTAATGAAMCLLGETEVSNTLIDANTASQDPGAIYSQPESDSFLVHCTLVNNPLAINHPAGTMTVNNCIFQYNNDDYQVSGLLFADYCLSDLSNALGNNSLTSTNADFVNGPAGNYNLQNASPALNNANVIITNSMDFSSLDFIGNPRTIGGSPDMGAFENQDGCSNPYDVCTSAVTIDLIDDYGESLELDCASGGTLNSDCNETVDKSIWLRFDIPPTGIQFIVTPQSSDTDIQIDAFSGDCSNLEYFTCSNNNGSGQNENVVIEGGPGRAYLRISSTNNGGGSVVLFPLILSSSISSEVTVGDFGSCYNGPDGLAVYDQELTVEYTNAPFGGNLVIERPFSQDEFFEITESPQTIVVTGLPAGYPSLSLTAKFFADGFETAFTTWEDAIEPPCCIPDNDECFFAQVIEIGDIITGSLRCATSNSWTPSSCVQFAGKDIWYSFQATSPSIQLDMLIDQQFNGGINPRFTLFSGECDNLTEVYCGNDFNAGADESHIIHGLQVGQSYLLRASLFNQQVGTFNLIINEAESPTCFGDLTGDGIINTGDISIVLGEFGCSGGCIADLNGDDLVNTADLSSLLTVFGEVCN